MATAAQWLEGARPRTLPAATAPVLAGTGAAAVVDGFVWWRALLALVVGLALQVGVNYANDYSDGVRGTDADRVGPLRLVGSGSARPGAVKRAALASFAVAAIAGLVLAAVSSWWLLLVGAAAIVGAWFYTGGSRPYGYRGLGEVSVFVFFGLVATVGTTYVQAEQVTLASVLAGVGCGSFACAILVANNLRDVETDGAAGKRTLAVLLGDARTRVMYAGLVAVPFGCVVLVGIGHPPALVALVAAALVVTPLRTVRGGARGRDLIVVLRNTGLTLLAYGALLGAGLALSG
ncbi:MAG: 1,4-dihydroxy-2-naphthoate polyprenyltransferase [Actinomycetota bacterium]|jgi:1,4-dihydroxy-2-naphthoate octaprenyltransferase|nr:1,4-dihydroxy-2-naphthoate polyprenyltransferase [Actinomycetota bacterium]